MSPAREAVLIVSALVVGFGVAFRLQWDTRGDPLRTWDWYRTGPPAPLVPGKRTRRLWVKVAPVVVLLAVIAFLSAALFMR